MSILNTFYLLTSIIAIISSSLDIKDNKYFEGQIAYKIEYELYDGKYQVESLKENIGSKIILTFRKGSYKKEYYSSSNKLLSTRYLDLKKGRSYARISDSDTILWFDITKNDSKTTFTIEKDSSILMNLCKRVKTITKVGGFAKNKNFIIKGDFFYSSNHSVNPKWYKNYRESNFNEIVEIGKGISILTFTKGPFWGQKIEIISSQKKKVHKDEIKFSLRKNEILKEI